MNLSVRGNFTLGPVTASSSATALASAAVGQSHALASGRGASSSLGNISLLDDRLGNRAQHLEADTWRVGSPTIGTPEIVTVRVKGHVDGSATLDRPAPHMSSAVQFNYSLATTNELIFSSGWWGLRA